MNERLQPSRVFEYPEQPIGRHEGAEGRIFAFNPEIYTVRINNYKGAMAQLNGATLPPSIPVSGVDTKNSKVTNWPVVTVGRLTGVQSPHDSHLYVFCRDNGDVCNIGEYQLYLGRDSMSDVRLCIKRIENTADIDMSHADNLNALRNLTADALQDATINDQKRRAALEASDRKINGPRLSNQQVVMRVVLAVAAAAAVGMGVAAGKADGCIESLSSVADKP